MAEEERSSDLFANGLPSASSQSSFDFDSSVAMRDEDDESFLLPQLLLLLKSHSNCFAPELWPSVSAPTQASSFALVSSLVTALIFPCAVLETFTTCFGLDNGIEVVLSSTFRSKFLIVRTKESSLVGTSRSRRSCRSKESVK